MTETNERLVPLPGNPRWYYHPSKLDPERITRDMFLTVDEPDDAGPDCD